MRTWVRHGSAAAALTLLAGFALVLSEWLFFVTKPSFLLSADGAEHLRILAVIPWAVAVPLAVVCLAVSLLVTPFSARLARHLAVLGAALLAAVLLMLMADNFSYTLFGIRSFDLSGAGRHAYLLLWLALLAWFDHRMAGWLVKRPFRRFALGAAAALALAAVVAASTVRPAAGGQDSGSAGNRPVFLPNMIIFSADGLDLRHLSAFGYKRTTSPFLESILHRGLVFENFFTNSATTTGSTGALLTGRLPTTTRVNFRPDVFRDEDAYRHLPGILRTLGYYNAEISVRYYNDADDLNLRRAFHWANDRSLDSPLPIDLPLNLLRAWNFELYFLQQTGDRVLNRLRHIGGVGPYADPYQEVTQTRIEGRDSGRLAQLRDLVQAAPEPFFINTHFMVTHGPRFPVYTRRYSANKEEKRKWMTDFYDDALLDVDTYLNFLFDFLQARGQLERTLIVYTTDHGERSKTTSSEKRLPLVFFFPGGEPSGRSSFKAQRIDIAPTLLDYLGVGVPEWMEGDSLLGEGISPTRPIFGTGTPPATRVGKFFEIADVEPPFYTLDKVYLIECQHYSRLHLKSGYWHTQKIQGHTNPCEKEDLLTDLEAKEALLRHLIERGYPAAALEKAAARDPAVPLPRQAE